MDQERQRPGTPPPHELKDFWLSVLPRAWSSLAVVPGGPGLTARDAAAAAWEVAHALELGDLQVLESEGMPPSDAARLQRGVLRLVESGTRVVVSVDYPLESPGALPVLAGVDAAVLLVRVGTSGIAEADRVIGLIGRARVLGCIAVGA
jgi:hypothetical protein